MLHRSKWYNKFGVYNRNIATFLFNQLCLGVLYVRVCVCARGLHSMQVTIARCTIQVRKLWKSGYKKWDGVLKIYRSSQEDFQNKTPKKSGVWSFDQIFRSWSEWEFFTTHYYLCIHTCIHKANTKECSRTLIWNCYSEFHTKAIFTQKISFSSEDRLSVKLGAIISDQSLWTLFWCLLLSQLWVWFLKALTTTIFFFF